MRQNVRDGKKATGPQRPDAFRVNLRNKVSTLIVTTAHKIRVVVVIVVEVKTVMMTSKEITDLTPQVMTI
jgi:hypothetical protein